MEQKSTKRVQNLWLRSGVYQAAVQVEGTLHRRSLRTTDAKIAKERLAAFIAELQAVAHKKEQLKAGRLPWENAVVRYHQEVASRNLRGGTQKRYLVSFGQVRKWLDGTYLDEITVYSLGELVRARKAEGATNATINRDLTAISRVLACGVAWGHCTTNPARDFDRALLTVEKREPRALATPAQVETVALECPGMVADAVRFAYLEGARQSEVFALTWDRVDLTGKTILFLTTKTSLRTSKPRSILLGDDSVRLLQSLPRPPRGSLVFWQGAGKAVTNPSKTFQNARLRVMAREAKEGREFPDFNFHDLRHAYAVNQLKAGRDVYDLSRHLGHSSVKVTEGYLGYVPGGSALTRHEVRGEVLTQVLTPVLAANGFSEADPL